MPKHLFVFSDGTWKDPEAKTQTNIFNLATMMANHNPSKEPQLVFYDPGIGSEGSFMSRLKGGAVGKGIDLNIQQLYTFLAMNYEEGDCIYLFGFSRGAYTVRSLAGMIYEAGLVYRHKLDWVKEAYDLYRDNDSVDSKAARSFRKKHSRRVPIKLVACFDTVGALGIPPSAIPFGNRLKMRKKYSFHDTNLNPQVEHGIHILSIDEDRKGFAPTYMDYNPRVGPTQTTQLFMPGYHSGVGGGSYGEKKLSDNALRCMIAEMKKRGLKIGWTEDRMPKEQDPCLPPKKLSRRYKLIRVVTGAKPREIRSLDMLHATTYKRYGEVKDWRPKALEKFSKMDTFLRHIDTRKRKV